MLITVLVWLALLAALALGASLVTMYEPATAAAAHDRLRGRRAAESALTLALLDLSARLDWSALPSGGPSSPFVDGAPGPRTLGDVSLDIAVETWRRTCGRVTACDDATTALVADDRPWGAANPRWRPFVHLPLAQIDADAARVCPCYLVAWVADDPADGDGDPLADAPVGVEGHGVLLVRGAVFAPGGLVAEVEALVTQPCWQSGAVCPGIRVQSWRSWSGGLS